MNTFTSRTIIPEIEVKIHVKKEDVVNMIQIRIKRSLTEEEREEVWNQFRQTENWFDVFPEEDADQDFANPSYLYNTHFVEDVQDVIQNEVEAIVNESFQNQFENLFEASLEEVIQTLTLPKEEPITFDNLAQQSQKRIQDENVKNGLARCANESKAKSIQKWKQHYLKTHILLPEELCGETREKFLAHIDTFFQ